MVIIAKFQRMRYHNKGNIIDGERNVGFVSSKYFPESCFNNFS